MADQDPKQQLAQAVAAWAAAGWLIESHSDYVAVLVQRAPTAAQGFAKGGLLGVAWAGRKQKSVRRVTLYADENGVREVS